MNPLTPFFHKATWPLLGGILVFALTLVSPDLLAGQLYRCQVGEHVVFQDKRCATGSKPGQAATLGTKQFACQMSSGRLKYQNTPCPTYEAGWGGAVKTPASDPKAPRESIVIPSSIDDPLGRSKKE